MASYFKSVLPEPYRILGLTLLPLSLGRYRLLKRFNCAFVAEEPAVPRPADLILGIFICSLRCDDFLDLVGLGDALEREISKWGNKVFGPKKSQRPKPFDYLHKVKLFKSYLGEGATVPEYWEEDQLGQNGVASGAHWSQSMEVVLRGELGWTLEEIQEAPLSKAISDYYKWLENKGVIRLIGEDESKQNKEASAGNSDVLEKFLQKQTEGQLESPDVVSYKE